MSQDYSNGYNLDNLKKLLNFKGEVKKENFDEKLIKIFNFFDSNKNGKLESSELAEIFKQVTHYGASKDKSVFDTQEANSFTTNYKNSENKTLKQLSITGENLYQFLDKVKNNVSNQIANQKTTMNLEITGLNTYKELSEWLYKQEGKSQAKTNLHREQKNWQN